MSEKIVEFFYPHPGEGGAAIPLPSGLKEAADLLSGQTMDIDEAIKRINEVAENISYCCGFCGHKVEAKDGYIAITLETPFAFHSWCLIRYRKRREIKMEQVKIFTGCDQGRDEDNSFPDLESAINNWLRENKCNEIVARQASVTTGVNIEKKTFLNCTVVIFYRVC